MHADHEARDASNLSNPGYGKLREPVVRAAHLMRAFKASSLTRNWLLDSTDDWLKQSPMTSPSVFNFWRPGYIPPNTTLGANNLVGPEFQAVNEITVSNYVNGTQYALSGGLGEWVNNHGQDIRIPLTDDAANAGDINKVIDHMNLVLLNGQMSDELKAHLTTAMSSIDITQGNADDQAEARNNRARIAILLTMASPEYIAQR